MNKCLFILFCVCLSQIVSAQEALTIPTDNRCTFSGTEWEDDLYRFEANPRVLDWVKEICAAGGVAQNFELIQASVENVAAVYDPATQRRYVLFSQNFIEKAASRLEVYAALAHEIGHHANLHFLLDVAPKGRFPASETDKIFRENLRKKEELEADAFMGYVLQKIKGIASLREALQIVTKLPTSYPSVLSDSERKEAITSGWKRSEISLTINSASFEADPNRELFLKAQFPFPPPPCCSPLALPRNIFIRARKLGDVANQISTAFYKQGYVYHKYLSVPNGFAMVTQLEQFNKDFTYRTDADRWSGKPASESFTDYWDYIKKMFAPDKSRFRMFVFIVTAIDFNIVGEKVTKQTATDWYNTGINRLPKSIASMPFTDDVAVTCLVYEFEVPEGTRRPKQKCPSIDTQKHLEVSRILEALKKM